jgi:hypothetical protein
VSKQTDLEALADVVRDFIDQEIPTVTEWNVNPGVIEQALNQIGLFFTQTDADVAAVLALFEADHDPTTGANPIPPEWVAEASTPTFVASDRFQLAGDRRADYAQAHRVRATLGVTQVIVAIAAVSFDSGANTTTVTVTPTSLTSQLSAIERGLVRASMPRIRAADLMPGAAQANFAYVPADVAGDSFTGPIDAPTVEGTTEVKAPVLRATGGAGVELLGERAVPANDDIAGVKAANDGILDLVSAAGVAWVLKAGAGYARKTLWHSGNAAIATGSYFGDGTASKTIALGFTPTFVLILGGAATGESGAVWGTNSGSKLLHDGAAAGTVYANNATNGFNGGIVTNGFKTGSGTVFNVTGVLYRWFAWRGA